MFPDGVAAKNRLFSSLPSVTAWNSASYVNGMPAPRQLGRFVTPTQRNLALVCPIGTSFFRLIRIAAARRLARRLRLSRHGAHEGRRGLDDFVLVRRLREPDLLVHLVFAERDPGAERGLDDRRVD